MSVAGDGGVDGAGPGVDTAGEGLGVVEALVAEPHGDGERALSVVAEDDDGPIRIEFGVGARGNLAHRHQKRVREAGDLELNRLADIEEKRRVSLIAKLEVGLGSDFQVRCGRVGHEFKDNAAWGARQTSKAAYFLQNFAEKQYDL